MESEMRTFNRLIETIVANPELVDEMKEAYKVCCNKEHRLYKLFKLYEKYNYITGAIFAYSNKENIEKHIALIVRTFINHIPTLLDYARK
ncbi:MAG: hypothetical protein LBF15_07040 [Candidatus Peribacteria bacterium]|nr:hypothetical protein [Candidatus Peribacteria bacterium]